MSKMSDSNGFTPSHVTNRLKSLSLDSDPNFRFQEESPRRNSNQTLLTLRALVTSKEAGVIIGKGGKNVNDIRETTGARAGVSKVIVGVPTRILSVSGSLEAVAKAYGIIAHCLIGASESSPEGSASLRILVAHALMGTIIGRMGTKIKQIQEVSGSKMVANKEMLSQSTERVVEIHGSPESIVLALTEIGRCLLADWDKSQGTILYNPTAPRANNLPNLGSQFYPPNFAGAPQTNSGEYPPFHRPPRYENGPRYDPILQQHMRPLPMQQQQQPLELGLVTKKLSIAADLVGCVIGKQGTKIAEIRRLSNSKVSIAKEPDAENNTRLFTIHGTPQENEAAIFLIYAQLEAEKERRAQQTNLQRQQETS